MVRDQPGSDGGGGGRRRAPHTRHDAEQQAEEIATRLRPATPPDELHTGAVPEAIRRPVEQWAGIDLSTTRLDTHTDPQTIAGGTGTIAAYDRSTIYPGLATPLASTTLGQDILRHELVHAAQERTAETTGQGASFRTVGPLRLNICGAPKESLDTLRGGGKLTADQAKGLLNTYGAKSPAERDAMVREFHKVGDANSGLQRLLTALDPAELQARRDLVSDMTERVQRITAEQTAGKTQAQLGAQQGATMKSEAEKRALAAAVAEAAAKGQPPPGSVPREKIAEEQNKGVKATSPITAADPVNAWNKPGVDHEAWNKRADKVIPQVVAACQKRAPDLRIRAANLNWAPEDIAKAGANVYTLEGDPILFGMSFVETAEADPEYVVRSVIHEIAGHPEFGDRFKSYEAQIYAEAHAKEPTLGQPWDTEEEINTFGYIGTEIYAAMREVPYEKPLTPEHAAKGLIIGAFPKWNIDNKIKLLKDKYVPKIAEALLQGLYERYRIDPRVSPAAMALFLKAAEDHFPKVLKR